MKRVTRAAAAATIVLSFAGRPLLATPAREPESESIHALARRVAREGASTEQRTRNLVVWMQKDFEWTWTDYARRTPEEVIARRAGNCAELASVLETLLRALGVESRWIAEINIQPKSAERQASAERRIAEVGNAASVFGLEHNDHRWLEVKEERTGVWFPADPAAGVVGIKEWEAGRMAFGKRPDPDRVVPAVAEITKDMLVPIAVLTLKGGRRGAPDEDRSRHYLIEQFDAFYGRRLHLLQGWREWTLRIRDAAGPARGAFEGRTNLHEEKDRIARIRATYEALGKQAADGGVAPAP